MDTDYIKFMIKSSRNVTEANNYIEKLGFLSCDDKIKFLEMLFDIQIISRKDSIESSKAEKEAMDYYAILYTLIFIK